MKNVTFQIAVAVMLLLMGCSQDELINDTSENSQLKKGSRMGGPADILCYGAFDLNGSIYSLSELKDELTTKNLGEGKFMLDGKFSGNIGGAGRIIPDKSTYKFDNPVSVYNNLYDSNNPSGSFSLNYKLRATGTISTGTRDNCIITITGVLQPYYYQNLGLFGGLILDGVAEITNGTGKLLKLNGKYTVSRRSNGGTSSYINLSTGEIGIEIGPKI